MHMIYTDYDVQGHLTRIEAARSHHPQPHMDRRQAHTHRDNQSGPKNTTTRQKKRNKSAILPRHTHQYHRRRSRLHHWIRFRGIQILIHIQPRFAAKREYRHRSHILQLLDELRLRRPPLPVCQRRRNRLSDMDRRTARMQSVDLSDGETHIYEYSDAVNTHLQWDPMLPAAGGLLNITGLFGTAPARFVKKSP